MGKTHLFLLICVILIATLMPVKSSGKRCASYCDESGNIQDTFFCDGESKYCCGTFTNRYCCMNETEDISNKWDSDVFNCRDIAMNLYHWQFLLGVMGILVMLVVIAACCCQCCTYKNSWNETREHRNRRTHRSNTNVSTIELEGTSQQPSFFDPSHPFAFVPPDYESLPKDPPAYSEIFSQSGSNNPAYNPDISTEVVTENRQGNRLCQTNSSPIHVQGEAPPAYQEEAESPNYIGNGQILQVRATCQNLQTPSRNGDISAGETAGLQESSHAGVSSQSSPGIITPRGVTLSTPNQYFASSPSPSPSPISSSSSSSSPSSISSTSSPSLPANSLSPSSFSTKNAQPLGNLSRIAVSNVVDNRHETLDANREASTRETHLRSCETQIVLPEVENLSPAGRASGAQRENMRSMRSLQVMSEAQTV